MTFIHNHIQKRSMFMMLFIALLCVATFVHAIVIPLWLIPLVPVLKNLAIGVAGSLTAAIIATLIIKLTKEKELHEQSIAELQEEQKEVLAKQTKASDKNSELQKKITDKKAELETAKVNLKTATEEYEAMKMTKEASEQAYNAKLSEFKQAEFSYNLHVFGCYYCPGSCSEGTPLYEALQAAEKAMGVAKQALDSTIASYNKEKDKKEEADNAVKKLEKDIAKLEKCQAKNAEEYTALTDRLTDVNDELKKKNQAKTDTNTELEILDALKEVAPSYMNNLHQAVIDGVDLGQWVIDNPPPTGFEYFISKYIGRFQ